MLMIIVTALYAVGIYFYFLHPLKLWEKKGIPYIKPWPIFGNLAPTAFRLRSFAHVFQDAYNTFPEERYVGFYNFSVPILIIRDPDLIRQITVKDFETFPEHRAFVPEDVDQLWSNNLFAMKGGKRWHDLRSTLSPFFTGSKMKIMFGLMKECSKQFSRHFLKEGGMVTVELKNAFTRFANDVIATTAFGITCDSLDQPNNEFYTMGKNLTNGSGLASLKFMVFLMSPFLTKLLRLRMFNRKVKKFFITLVKDTVKVREENNVYRPDMIHLLMQVRQGQLNCDNSPEMPDSEFAVVKESEYGKPKAKRQKVELNDIQMTAQVLIFFFAGFDTASTLMCHASYELALNPVIQEKLHSEIKKGLEETHGEFTYESITAMKYLDMVISEALRKWSPFVHIDRRSVRPYTIKAKHSNERDLHLDTNSICMFPIYSIHRDPKYYPNPDKFDPERFSEENRQNIRPFTYLPFGAGPRNCIGSRFALLESKLVLAEIVSKFELVPVAKSEIPLVLSKIDFNPLPDNGFWLGLKPRNIS